MLENKEQKNKKSKKTKQKNWKKIIMVIILLSAFIGTGVVGGIVFAAINSAPPIDPANIYTLIDENSFILDQEGNMIEKVESDGSRTIVKYNKIPDNLKNAFIAIEDQHFFEHRGISPKRILKAVWEDIKAGAPVQGASTITQQLAKNLYLSHDKTISRKIKEAYYALQLERHLTKKQILEAYLNTAYIGSGAKGVQAAAHIYFSKDVNELDLAESALIAGITKNPSKYSPFKTLKKEDVDPNKHFIIDDDDEIYTIVYDDGYKDRQKLVLTIMKNENMITEGEYEEAINEDMKSHLKPGKHNSENISSYFTDQVKRDVVKTLMKELNKSEEEAMNMLYNQGLRIYSTMDLKMQKKLEETYKNSNNFPGLSSRRDRFGNIINKNNKILLYKYENLVNNNEQLVIPRSEFEYDGEGNLILYNKKRFTFSPFQEDGEIKGIRVAVKDSYIRNAKNQMELLKGGVIKIPNQYKEYDEEKNLIISKEFLSSNPQFFTRNDSGNLLIEKGNYSISNKGIVQPQSAMVIIDYRKGEIKALVGGRNVEGKQLYNRAINPRQPGSAIKPLAAYTPALDNGLTAGSIIDDVPQFENGRLWPRNYDNRYRGLTTLREGIISSINVVAVKVVQEIGVNTSIDYLKKMGITSIVEKGPSNDKNTSAMGLGGMTRGISPLELTAAYGSLANEGVYVEPKSFIKITDRDGNIILENKSNKHSVVGPDVAFIMTDMMRDVVTSGTGRAANLGRMPAAGKTGTTSDNHDAWFVGYTPYYVAGVWIGNDVQMDLTKGSTVSARLWKNVMSQIHQDLPSKDFRRPSNIISVAIDTESGKLPTKLSRMDPRGSTVRNEYFIRGTEPREYDDVHIALDIDITTKKLANPYCPSSLVKKQVFIRRPIPYSGRGPAPLDAIYQAPSAYCDFHNENNKGVPIEEIPLIPTPPENNNPSENNNPPENPEDDQSNNGNDTGNNNGNPPENPNEEDIIEEIIQ